MCLWWGCSLARDDDGLQKRANTVFADRAGMTRFWSGHLKKPVEGV